MTTASPSTMTPSEHAPRRWLTPTGIVAGIFVVLVAVLGGTALSTIRRAPPELRFFDPRRSPTFDETCVVSAMDYALSSDERNDVIFLGDSVCRTGLDPVTFERSTGLRAYNLGIVGDLGPGVMRHIVEAYLAKHPKPRLIILCVSPLGLEHDVPWYWIKLRDHFVNCYGGDSRSLPSATASLGYTVRQGTVLAWNRAASAFNEELGDVRDAPLIGMEKVTYRGYERLTREKRGHFDLPGRGPSKNLDRPGGMVLVHDVWDSEVRRLAAVCDNAGVPLMIRFGPVLADATKNLKFERVEQWSHDLQVSSPGSLLASDQPILRYPPELCWDYSHPNPQGAQRFTEHVAAEVRLKFDSDGKDRGR